MNGLETQGGTESALAPLLALADAPEGLPAELRGAMAEYGARQRGLRDAESALRHAVHRVCEHTLHALVAGDRERLALLGAVERTGTELTEVQGYRAWRRRAEALRPVAEALPCEGAVDSGSGTLLGKGKQELARALGFDDTATALLADWRAHCARAERTGASPVHVAGYEGLISRMDILAAVARLPREIPPALAAARHRHADLVADSLAVRSALTAVRGSLETRSELLDEAFARHCDVTEHRDYADLRHRTLGALARMGPIMRNEERHRPHATPLAGGWTGLVEDTEALDAALARDARAQGLCREWRALGQHAHERNTLLCYVEGHEALRDRIAQFEREIAHPGEVPRALRFALRHATLMCADRDVVKGVTRRFAQFDDETREMADESHYGGFALALHPSLVEWRERGESTLRSARALLDEELRFRPHLDESDGGFDGFMRNGRRLIHTLERYGGDTKAPSP